MKLWSIRISYYLYIILIVSATAVLSSNKAYGQIDPTAQQYINTQRFQEAIDYCTVALNQTISGFRNAPQAYARQLASAYLNLGYCYSFVNTRKDQAEINFNQAVEILTNYFGPNDPDIALSYYELGLLYHTEGRLIEAENTFRQANHIFETSNSWGGIYAYSLDDLGTVYRDEGKFTDALNNYFKALQIYPLFHMDSAQTISKIGISYGLENDFNDAENYELMALNMTKHKLYQGSKIDSFNYANFLNALAITYGAFRKFDSAQVYYDRLLAFQEAIYTHNSLTYARALGTTAFFYKFNVRNYAKAVKLSLEAKTIAGQFLPSSEIEYNKDFVNPLAEAYYLSGDFPNAKKCYQEIEQNIANYILRYFSQLTERQQEAFYNQFRYLFERYGSLTLDYYHRDSTLAGDLYNIQLFTKNILFRNSQKLRKEYSQTIDRPFAELYSTWVKDRSLRGVLGAANCKAVSDSIDYSTEQIEKQLLQGVAHAGNEYADLSKCDWRQVQTMLSPGEAAVEIIRVRDFNIDHPFNSTYIALIVLQEKNSVPSMVVLGNAEAYENAYYTDYLKSLQDEGELLLYDLFWKPIAEKLKGAKKVYLSQDGVFNKINLNVVHNPGEDKYLMDDVQINYILSTAELYSKTDPVQNKIDNLKDKPGAIVFMGDPTYDLKPRTFFNNSCFTGNGQVYTELNSSLEIAGIKAFCSKNNIKANYFVADSASEFNLRKINNPIILHISTHGYFLGKDSISKWNDYMFSAYNNVLSNKPTENPLYQSGLALTSANYDATQKDCSDDGLLNASEAMNLNLDSTELLVLSACVTGSGALVSGQGVYGLQKSFKLAGVKNMIISLWDANARVTSEFMNDFYSNLMESSDIEKSFYESQAQIRQRYSTPFLWGPFVLLK